MCFAIPHRQLPRGWSTPREDDLPIRSKRNDDMNRVRSAQRASVRPPTVFRDTARLLCATRAFVVWAAVGSAMGAYVHALAYAQQRVQLSKPIALFNWCKLCW